MFDEETTRVLDFGLIVQEVARVYLTNLVVKILKPGVHGVIVSRDPDLRCFAMQFSDRLIKFIERHILRLLNWRKSD